LRACAAIDQAGLPDKGAALMLPGVTGPFSSGAGLGIFPAPATFRANPSNKAASRAIAPVGSLKMARRNAKRD
jgi:hypothetical protein